MFIEPANEIVHLLLVPADHGVERFTKEPQDVFVRALSKVEALIVEDPVVLSVLESNAMDLDVACSIGRASIEGRKAGKIVQAR
jgi:hypothetical protein